MTDSRKAARSVVKEPDLSHPPEKVWHALTQKHLIEDWLMENDFRLEAGHRFKLDADRGTVIGEVLAAKPQETLAYTWEAQGLQSIVTWTLTKTETGTRLRMEQTGFGADQELAFRGAQQGWNRFLDRLEQVVSKLD